jgi:hypothetical protein
MATEIESFLSEVSNVDESTAKFLSQYIEILPNDLDGAALQELIEESKPGKTAVIISRHPRNLLVNWGGLLFNSIPGFIIGGAGAFVNPALGALGCLQVLYQLVKARDIELGTEHEAVVRKLWIDKKDRDKLTWAELEELFGNTLPPGKLNAILDDLDQLGIIAFDQSNDGIEKLERLILKP